MKPVWLPGALAGLDRQIDWLAERSPAAATAMSDAIHAAVSRLGRHPASGRPGRVAGTREAVVAGTPYVVVYRIESATVVVLRVLHGAQRWPPREL